MQTWKHVRNRSDVFSLSRTIAILKHHKCFTYFILCFANHGTNVKWFNDSRRHHFNVWHHATKYFSRFLYKTEIDHNFCSCKRARTRLKGSISTIYHLEIFAYIKLFTTLLLLPLHLLITWTVCYQLRL